jgi:hypothetical protein
MQQLSINERIRRIVQSGGVYDPDSSLDVTDQFLICESLRESTPIYTTYDKEKNESDENGNVNRSVNGGCKRTPNTKQSPRNHDAIEELAHCGYRTNSVVIARYLEQIFMDYPCKEGHWFYIAQHWTPRPINQVLNYLKKLEFMDNKGIRNPAAYFTYLIKKRKRRKSSDY